MTKAFSFARRAAEAGRFSTILAVAIALAWGASGSPLQAQVICGGTVGPGGNVQMLGDLSCGNEGITVEGPVNFNMKGFTLDCNGDDEHGITVIGEDAVIQNGTITDCDDGVFVAGTGGHQLLKLTVIENESDGIELDSDNNTLVGNTAEDNGADGFDIESSGNRLVDNVATENNSDGFDIDDEDADSNRLVGNTAHDNGSEGFEIDGGSTDNTLINNTSTENDNSGFDIDGSDNLLLSNSAVDNGEDGFEVASDNEIDGGVGNELRNNTATGNDEHGIVLQADADDNVIRQNTAKDNVLNDIQDDTAGCGGNTWFKNKFGTSSQACEEE
jgi:parallel beta-helix repeat protein